MSQINIFCSYGIKTMVLGNQKFCYLSIYVTQVRDRKLINFCVCIQCLFLMTIISKKIENRKSIFYFFLRLLVKSCIVWSSIRDIDLMATMCYWQNSDSIPVAHPLTDHLLYLIGNKYTYWLKSCNNVFTKYNNIFLKTNPVFLN